MSTRRTIAALVLGFMLLTTMGAQTAFAQVTESNQGNNSTDVDVTVTDGGIFDAYFCDSSGPLTQTSLTQTTAPTVNAAGAADGTLIICYTDTKIARPSFDVDVTALNFINGPNSIPSSGFTVEYTYNVLQLSFGAGVGDIGYFVNDAYVAQNPAGQGWTANQNLDVGRTVNFGFSGQGTIASGGVFDVGLVIPAATPPGTYTSDVTLSILVGSQP